MAVPIESVCEIDRIEKPTMMKAKRDHRKDAHVLDERLLKPGSTRLR